MGKKQYGNLAHNKPIQKRWHVNKYVYFTELIRYWSWSPRKMEVLTFKVKTRKKYLAASCRRRSEKPAIGSTLLKPSDKRESPGQCKLGSKKGFLWKWKLRPRSQGRQWSYGDKNYNRQPHWYLANSSTLPFLLPGIACIYARWLSSRVAYRPLLKSDTNF